MKINKTILSSLSSFLFLAMVSSAFANDRFRPIPPILLGPKEIPCAEALKPYFDWASGVTPAEEDVRGVTFTLVYNQQKNAKKPGVDAAPNLVGYSVGGLQFQGGTLVGDVSSYFSDRTFCPNPPSGGGFCTVAAPFNPGATDVAQITIQPNGQIMTVLKSWGNAKYQDQMVCMDNGVFFTPTKLGQKYMSVITLQKTGYRRPR